MKVYLRFPSNRINQNKQTKKENQQPLHTTHVSSQNIDPLWSVCDQIHAGTLLRGCSEDVQSFRDHDQCSTSERPVLGLRRQKYELPKPSFFSCFGLSVWASFSLRHEKHYRAKDMSIAGIGYSSKMLPRCDIKQVLNQAKVQNGSYKYL